MSSSGENSGSRANEHVGGLSEDSIAPLRYNVTSAEPFEATRVIMSLIGRGSRVLDIGCGTGTMTHLIETELEAEVIGIEPNPARAEAARSLGLNVITGLFEPGIEKTYGKFDCVILADVLEHLEDPSSILHDAKSVLRSGGHLVASIPNVAHWTVRMALLRGNFDYTSTGIMDATHLRWFTRKTVETLFRSADYDIDVLTHTAGAWMRQYRSFPFSLIEQRRRAAVVNWLAAHAHGLFACQHVISARPVERSGS